MKVNQVLGTIFIGMTFSAAVNSFAGDTSTSVRKDINVLVFGAAEDSQKYSTSFAGTVSSFAPDNGTCSVSIESDPEAKVTEISIGGSIEARFVIADSDEGIVKADTYNLENGVIYIGKDGPSGEPTALSITRSTSGTKTTFCVTIALGFKFPFICQGF